MEGLIAKDIRVDYGSGSRTVRALNSVDIAVTADRSIGIAGESGSGKSTLARVLVGMIKPNAGSVSWNGTDLTALGRTGNTSIHRTVQMVFQDPTSSLNPRMRVGESIREALMVNDINVEHKAEVRRLLELVELSVTDVDKYPFQLSGGQKQRVAIARALAARPQVLICDEMTSALDVSVQAAVLKLLNDVRAETGLALAVITHNLDVVKHLCDDVVILRHGEIVERGATSAVFSAPEHQYTRTLLAAVPRFRFPPLTRNSAGRGTPLRQVGGSVV